MHHHHHLLSFKKMTHLTQYNKQPKQERGRQSMHTTKSKKLIDTVGIRTLAHE